MSKRTCTYEDCERPHDSLGYCKTHADQVRRGREPYPIGSRPGGGSKRPVRFASPDDVIQQLDTLTSVDDNGCWLWTDRVNHYGYGVYSCRGKTGFTHRTTFTHFVGPIPDGHEIDHICWNRLCCNPDHLRAVTRKQNCENFSAAATVRSKSGVRGVYRNREGTYDWSTMHNGVEYAGYGCRTIEEAAEAVRIARLNLHTHNTRDRVSA